MCCHAGFCLGENGAAGSPLRPWKHARQWAVKLVLCILLFVLCVLLISIVVVTFPFVCCSVTLPLSRPASFLPVSFYCLPHSSRAGRWVEQLHGPLLPATAKLEDACTTGQHPYTLPRIPVPASSAGAFLSCYYVWPAGLNSAILVSFFLTWFLAARNWELMCSTEIVLKVLPALFCSPVPEDLFPGGPTS